MNISNLMGQYNQATSAGAEKLTGTKGVENLVSSLKSLTKGNIFEGTVSSMKNGKITLALSNGTQVSARMEGKVSLSVGQSMFFQVKSNDGSQIAIRPFVMDGNGVNYTLMQALSAAGLPAESNYLSMVNKMMEEQMPIDRSSLQQMARLVNSNSSIDVQTLVQMTKLGITVTPENAAQFESYLGDRQAITSAFDELIDMLPTIMQGSNLSEEGLRQMNSQVLSIVTEGLIPEAAEGQPGDNLLLLAAERTAAEQAGEQVQPDALSGRQVDGADAQAVGEAVDAADAQTGAAESGTTINEQPNTAANGEALQMSGEAAPEDTAAQADASAAGKTIDAQTNTAASGEAVIVQADGEAASEGAGVQTDGMTAKDASAASEAAETKSAQEAPEAKGAAADAVQPKEHTLAAVLDRTQLDNLNRQLGRLVGQDRVNYTPQQNAAEVLDDLQRLLRSEFPVDRGSLQRLLSSDTFKSLVRDTMEQQWTIKPEDLKGSDQINKLYEKQDSQMNRMADVMRATGRENVNFTQLAADIRGNVDFMNQVNQLYTYVQIPLKMSGQNASGELFVYTNKRALAEGDKDLTAFLHLDMENLGSTDVSVRMRGKEVSTNFYLENDEAYDLIEKHMPILEKKLREKGYNCTVSVVNEGKHVNFVDDFLKRDQPSAGQLHRYSFDMRA